MAAKKTSKTARASVMAGAGKNTGGFIRAADGPLTVPTGGGEYAYVYTLNGKTLHIKTRSDEFVAEIAKFVEGGFADRINRELADHASRYDAFQAAIEKINAPAEENTSEETVAVAN